MRKLFIFPFLLLFLIGCGLKPRVISENSGDELVESQAVKPDYVYKSDKYSFALKDFPKDYDVKYLEESGGIAFKKFVKQHIAKLYPVILIAYS